MRAVATAKRKPSARALAPFSIALFRGLVRSSDSGMGSNSTHLASLKGLICLAGSPRMLVRSLTSERYMNWASSTHSPRNVSCLEGKVSVHIDEDDEGR